MAHSPVAVILKRLGTVAHFPVAVGILLSLGTMAHSPVAVSLGTMAHSPVAVVIFAKLGHNGMFSCSCNFKKAGHSGTFSCSCCHFY